ncbi:MAG: cytochrome c oxidase subunit 3 [Flavobacteriales bacterium]|nr:cytochrome c oxidase subunit 3 [Flavobacteriales bacterium]
MDTVSYTVQEELQLKRKNNKTLMWIANAAIVMMFAALTSAYLVSRSTDGWMFFELPTVFWYSTIFIVASSITMIMAQRSARLGNNQGIKLWIWATFLLGGAFAYTQYHALFTILFDSGIYFTGKGSNISGQFLYFIAIFHLVHLTAGLLSLLFTVFKASRNKYTKEDYTGIEVCSIYWHFLDVLWVYLFVFLLLIR